MSFIKFEETNFTMITDDNEKPWFTAKELCDYLGILNASQAIKRLPDDWKKKIRSKVSV